MEPTQLQPPKWEVSETDSSKLPPTDRHVIVTCEGFRCLGYRDDACTWRNAFTNETLPQVFAWEPV